MNKLILLVAVALIAPFFANAQSNTRTIDLSMSCDTLVTPDIFTLDINLVDNKGAGKAGLEKAEKSILVPQLKKMGIDVKKDLVISSTYSNYEKGGKLVTSKSYNLTVRSVEMMNKVIETLTDSNIIVSLRSSSLSNESEIADLMRLNAIRKSKEYAKAMAEAAGCELGVVMKINSFINVMSSAKNEAMTSADLNVRGVNSNFDSAIERVRQKRISANVNMSYQLK